MKNAQTTVEYVMIFVLITLFCVYISMLWNRNAIINGSTFGTEDENNVVHVRPMTD